MKLIAVYHPPPNSDVMKHLPPSYQLTHSELHASLSAMIGAPITVEHLGVIRASEQIEGDINHAMVSKQLMQSPNPSHRRIGVCTDAWEGASGEFFCMMEVICGPMPGLRWMITSKMLGSVSLTHTLLNKMVVPLEIALVGIPARPSCTVRFITECPLRAAEYKGLTLTPSKTKQMTESSKPDTCQTALDALDPKLRELVVARFQHLVSAANSAVQKTAEMEKTLKASKWAADTDTALLASQLTQLIGTMNPESLENFSLTVPSTLEAYKSGDASQILNASLRTIMCANQNMMLMAATGVPGTKRARVEEKREEVTPAVTPQVVAEVPAVVPQTTPLTNQQLLEQALYKEFEVN
jgi:hypothetical protein